MTSTNDVGPVTVSAVRTLAAGEPELRGHQVRAGGTTDQGLPVFVAEHRASAGDFAYVRPVGVAGGARLEHEHRGLIVAVQRATDPADDWLTVRFDDLPPGYPARQCFYANETRITHRNEGE